MLSGLPLAQQGLLKDSKGLNARRGHSKSQGIFQKGQTLGLQFYC